jgi:hypothetical protein
MCRRELQAVKERIHKTQLLKETHAAVIIKAFFCGVPARESCLKPGKRVRGKQFLKFKLRLVLGAAREKSLLLQVMQ